MKKLSIVLLLIFSVMMYASLMDHLPQNYTSFTYIYDLQKLYSTFKNIPIGKALMTDLGLEAMVNSMLQAYEVDPKSLSNTKELLFAADEKNSDYVLAIGPIEKAQDLAYLIKNTIQSMFENEKVNVNIDNVGKYLVTYSSEEYLDSFMKGGGKYKDDPIFHKAGAVGIGYASYEGSESYSVLYISGNSIEGEMKIISKEALEYLKPYKKLKPSDLPRGDVLVILNANNVRGIIDKVEELSGNSILSEEDKEKIPKSGYVVAGMDINETISQALEESLSGSTGVSISATPNAIIHIVSSDPFEDQVPESCQKISSHEYKCEDATWSFSSPNVATMRVGKESPTGNAAKLFKEVQNGNEFLAVAWDMTGALKSLGLSANSYLMIRGWLDKGVVKIHFQLK